MFPAEASFQAGEFELALNGDGNSLGFAQVIDEYGSKAGASAYLYAGVCELQLGNYENALNYLKKYNGKDAILAARALACQGDAYVGLEKYKDALSCFEKAAAKSDNIFSAAYLLKAGVVCEELGDNQKALSLYKQINIEIAIIKCFTSEVAFIIVLIAVFIMAVWVSRSLPRSAMIYANPVHVVICVIKLFVELPMPIRPMLFIYIR